MKTLYLRTCDSEGDIVSDRIYACEHPRKNETDLRQDYKLAFDFATTENPEEWSMLEVFAKMESLGWSIKDLDLVSVQY